MSRLHDHPNVTQIRYNCILGGRVLADSPPVDAEYPQRVEKEV